MEAAKTKEKKKAQKPEYGVWSNVSYMVGLAWKSEKWVLWLCLVQAALAVGSRLINLFIAPAVLGAVEASAPVSELLVTILFFVLALMLTGALSAYVNENTLFGRIAVRGNIITFIHDKFAKVAYPKTEDPAYLKKREKASQTVNANSKATEAIWGTLTDLLQNIAGFVIYLALLASLDLFVVAITLATTVTGYYISKPINRWGYRHREEESEISRGFYYISDKTKDYKLAKDIRIFGMGDWLRGMQKSSQRLFRDFYIRGQRVYIWADIVDLALTFARNGIAYLILITLTLERGLGAAQFLLYFAAVGGFTSWVTGILSGFSTLHTQSLDISATREYLGEPELFKFEDGQPLEPVRSGAYEIELKNVSFRYPGAEKDALRGINLKIPAGEKLAVVGRNGAGKTTLIKLICGFYDPTQGEVLLNGKNIKDFNRRDYYRHFSAVFQTFSMLASSVAGNIAQSEDGIDMERVHACADMAGLTKKIESLPAAYDSHLGKEVFEDAAELSGGETQRLMLARALYKNAPIIVLDEPTAALDPIAESDIYNKYNDLTGGRTSVYISHRLASTRFCDRIIHIDSGEIAEEGTHDELLIKNGGYAKLFEIQSHYYREETPDEAK